jgi:tetratricopeptide (TPR) repeat protein
MLCRTVGFVLLAASIFTLPRSGPSLSSVTDLLERYDSGDYEAVTAAFERDSDASLREFRAALNRPMPEGSIPRMTDLLPLPDQFISDAKRWIRAGGLPAAEHRRLVAATLALEIAHARRRVQPPAGALFATLACRLMRESPLAVPREAERRWYLASIAAIEDMYAWPLLSGPVSPFSPYAKVATEERPFGHVAHARERFPDEPRFRLAQVVARDYQSDRTGLRRDVQAYGQQIRAYEVPPAALADLRERAGRNKRSRDQQNAADLLAQLESLPQIAAGYTELAEYPEIRAEVELRFGYLAVRLLQWDRAIEHVTMVPTLTTDPDFIYASHYIRGWASQRAGRRQDAIDAYRQATAMRPDGRSARMLLASQLFLSDRLGDRDAAYDEVQAASRLPQTTADPWRIFKQSEGRLWSERIAELREALHAQRTGEVP